MKAMYMLDIDIEKFNRNLLLTQAYCEQVGKSENIASDLRSFNPEINGRSIFSYKVGSYWITEWNIDPIMSDDKYLYDELYKKQIIYKRECVKTLNRNTKYNGKVLLAEIDMTVVDGASEAESEGLIDGNDCPPIDTWFYITRKNNYRILFSWIPEPFVDLANKAIEVNCVDCLKWFDENLYRNQLKQINVDTTWTGFMKKLLNGWKRKIK